MSGKKILYAGLNKEIKQFFSKDFADSIYFIESKEQFYEEFISFYDGQFLLAYCDSGWGSEFYNEFAQIIKNQCPSSKILLLTTEIKDLDVEAIISNGFTEINLWPTDRSEIENQVLLILSSENSSVHNYKPVQVLDIEPQSKLPFDVYINLPKSNKYIKYCKKGVPIGEKRFNKLIHKGVGAFHINYNQVKEYYDYTSKQINSSVNTTVKKEKFKSITTQLFIEIFNTKKSTSYDDGKTLMSHFNNLVKDYVSFGNDEDWYKSLLRSIGPLGNFSHSNDVSTLAAFFAICLDCPNPEQLAIAGLLHDLSLIGVDETLLFHSKTLEPTVLYKNHPMNSLNAIAQKKMVISDQAKSAIEQHHEHFDGSGFPKKLYGENICEAAQILLLADLFAEIFKSEIKDNKLDVFKAISSIEETGWISRKYTRALKKCFSDQGKELETKKIEDAAS